MKINPSNLIQFLILLFVLIINSACQTQTATTLPVSPIDTSLPLEITPTSPSTAAALPSETIAGTPSSLTTAPEPMQITTTAFEPGGVIPQKYTCFGDNTSPELEWSGVPPEAQSLVLLVYDLDAGSDRGASTPLGFAHWIVYNIPPDAAGYPEDLPLGEIMEDGAMQGTNDYVQFRKQGEDFPGGAPIKLVGYDGPCPPSGAHRYIFVIHALNSLLGLPPGATLTQVLEAMEGHTLNQAEIIAFYAPP